MNPLISFLAPNQAVINLDNKRVFQSYESEIATIEGNSISLTDKWNYSKTTIKYLCIFLGVKCKKDIENGINNGTYKLI